MTIAVYTLGCKVNQCDADALIKKLNEMGHNAFATRDFATPVDMFVINTCTVTHVSDKKSRQMIRRAKKANPQAKIAMCGCMAKTASNNKIEGVDFVFDARKPPLDVLAEPFETRTITGETPLCNTRSFIKIQDGCDRFCSYCIVPHVRGEVSSRLVGEILSEAENFINQGSLEIVLTGIQVACYGQDTGECTLPALIKKINALDGLKRFRLSSIDPWAINTDFLSAVADSNKLCSHFHLSLQSGCDNTLKNMNRRYTTDEYAHAAESLRKLRQNVAITTDIIVGFPNESVDDFEKSLNFVQEMKFAQVHVFEFSPRQGTPAATFEGQIPPAEKTRRGKIMRKAVSEMQSNFLRNQIGQTHSVLFEKNIGYTENYCSVQLNNKKLSNTIQKVLITACEGETLTGNLQ